MRKIENIDQLRQEYVRLNVLKDEQEALLIQDIKDIGESLKPINIVRNVAGDLFTSKNSKTLLVSGINLGMHLLSNRLIAKESGSIIKTVLAYVGQNVASNFISNRSESIIDKVKGFFNFGKNGAHKNSAHEKAPHYN